jgi:photosystem II stability/assembly factor-like uncharacterized protein
MKKITVIVILFLFCWTTVKSVVSTVDNSFLHSKNKLDRYLQTYDTLPKGWKQYKRAEAFWQNRLMPNGEPVSPKYLLNELNKALKENSLEYHHEVQSQKVIEQVQNSQSADTVKNWTAVGPFSPPSRFGIGRVDCVTVDPENDSIIWVGAASGGIWRSKDRGENWEVIPFTDILSTGIMYIEFAPSNPNIMYATSGDHHNGVLFKSYSLGVLKSVDRGETWKIMSETLDFADSISYSNLLIHPENADIVYVGTTRSILKTTDGGETWSPIIEGHYFRHLKFKPDNPNVIYASTMLDWSQGGAKIFITVDAGQTWEMIKDMPEVRRIELATTPANPELLYVLTGYYHTHGGMEGLYIAKKNDLDGSFEWDTIMNRNNRDSNENYRDFVASQSFFNLTIAVSPTDENFIIKGGVFLGFSTDRGKTWTAKTSSHVDHHEIKFVDSIIYVGNDGGINKISYQGLYEDTEKWQDISDGLSITQYYRMGAHPYSDKLLLAGCQDNGTHLLRDGKWHHYSGGDGMECQFNPQKPRTIKTTAQRGMGLGLSGLDNTAWITTFIINPLTADTTLVCGTNVWAQYWEDMQVTDTFFVYDIDGVIIDTVYRDTVKSMLINNKLSDFPNTDFPNELRAIAISTVDKNYIYASSVYRLFYTDDYGENWKEIYNELPTVSYITVSDEDPELFWTAHSGHFAGEKVSEFQNGIRKNISYNLPNVSINTVAYYPTEKTLFAGTDMGVFKLEHNSQEWKLFNDGMPLVCVMELEYVPRTGYLYAASWGRGVWKMQLEEHNVIEPQISLHGENWICEYDFPITVYNIDKQEGYEYFWCDGSTADSLQIDWAGHYYLIGISPEGHSEVSNILTVKVNQLFFNHKVALLMNRNPACIGDTVKYRIHPNFSQYDIEWSNGSKDSIAYFTEEGEVYVNIIEGDCYHKRIIDTVRFVSNPQTPKIERHKNFLICVDSAFRYQWKIDDEYTEITNTNFIEIKKAGVYQAIVRNETHCSAISEAFLIEAPNSENNERIKTKLYPNPNSGIFNLELFSEGVEEVELKLYDNAGRLASDYSLSFENYYYLEFDFSNYFSGSYYFELTTKDYKRIIPFVVVGE